MKRFQEELRRFDEERDCGQFRDPKIFFWELLKKLVKGRHTNLHINPETDLKYSK
ncbi:MAG: hypothetical protein HZB65_04960 [Candidatus Aenigmarchaeota archaeon]|nr:hypothetical protein [Candidatus Aenigmarchaeota archaeon]